MAEWLRWYTAKESQYRQEPIEAVRSRARRMLPYFKPLAQTVPVSIIEAKKTVAKIRPMIANPLARDLISQELMAMVGRRFTKKEVTTLACRVAGSCYAAGRGVQPYLLSAESPMRECLGVVRNVVRGGEFRDDTLVVLEVVVSNGQFCSEVVELQFKLSTLQRWGSWFGLVNRRKNLKLKTAMGFLDCQIVCRLEREAGGLVCLGSTVLPAHERYNRRLMQMRHRQFERCPYGAQHDCEACPVGRNQCTRSLLNTITNFQMRGSSDGEESRSVNDDATTVAES